MSFLEDSEALNTIMQSESIATEQYDPYDIPWNTLIDQKQKGAGDDDVESLGSETSISSNSSLSLSSDSTSDLFYESLDRLGRGDNYKRKKAPHFVNIQSMSSSEFNMGNNTSEIKLVSASASASDSYGGLDSESIEPHISNYFFEMSNDNDAFSSTSNDFNASTIEQFSNIRQNNTTSSINLISEDGKPKKAKPKPKKAKPKSKKAKPKPKPKSKKAKPKPKKATSKKKKQKGGDYGITMY
jgi:hypothetical protein